MGEQEQLEEVLDELNELIKKGKFHFTCDDQGRVQLHLEDGRIYGLSVTGFERVG